MKCIACDNDLTDRESKAKDEAGEYVDLCGECLPVSREAVLDAAAATDWQDDGVEEVEDLRDDATYWIDFLALHWSNLHRTWGDGLGLMSPEARVMHLRWKAEAKYTDELSRGTPRPLAAELAINAPWALDRYKMVC